MNQPQPDRKLYDDILNAGFAKYPERKENWERFLSTQKDCVGVQYVPIKIDIEPTSRCNLRCGMCIISDMVNGKRTEDLTYENFTKIVSEQKGIVEIKLQGVGEPLLNKDLFRMIQFARKRDLWVRTSTNGTLLHLNNAYKELVDSDICEVQISVDGARPETYERIRRGAKFDVLTKNAILLNNYSEKRGKKRTRMWVLLQKDNIQDIMQFPDVAKNLGFSRLTIVSGLVDWGQEKWKEKNIERIVNQKIEYDVLEKKAKSIGVEISLWDVHNKFSIKRNNSLCPWPFSRMYISSDMRIVPCCTIGNPDTVNFGSYDQWEEKWFGLTYKQFRSLHVGGDIPKYCRGCYEKNEE